MKKTKTISKRFQLLAIGGDPKTRLGQAKGWLTAILYLVPAGQLGTKDLCPWKSEGCEESCLFGQGRGKMNNVQQARLRKTLLLQNDPQKFLDILCDDILKADSWTKSKGYKLAVRLNGTSDVSWENLADDESQSIIDAFPTVQFYDYTKGYHRILKDLPENYSLTFSRSEGNERKARKLLELGKNVAVVFRHKLPKLWHGRQVIDGTKNDLRFLDCEPVVVGLLAKGTAKQDQSGFVVDYNSKWLEKIGCWQNDWRHYER